MTKSGAAGLAFLEAFWAGDIPAALRLCAPGAQWTFQTSIREPRHAPVADAIDYLMGKLVSGFDPDTGYTVALGNVIAEGEESAVEYSASGRTRRGEIYQNYYVVRFTVRDGLIVSIRPYFDTHYVSRRLVSLD